MKLYRSVFTPRRVKLTTSELWGGDDLGLIACWERGRAKAIEAPDLAKRAVADELVTLPWKGGIEKAIKSKTKYGSYRYLAMWQGLRGEDLDFDTTQEIAIVCAKFGVPVIFTWDMDKLAP